MFPDSQIAAQFSCGGTKTKAIVCNAIADELKNSTVPAMISGPFSLLTNDTTYITNHKQCCLLLRYFANTTDFTKGSFYKVLHISRATSESIFSAITDAFAKDSIPIRNLTALGTHGAAPMVGREPGGLISDTYKVHCITSGGFVIVCILLPKRLLTVSLVRCNPF